MFNPLTPADVVAAIGRSARAAARSEGAGDEFQRGQLLSAYSASRHLAVEISLFPAVLAAFRSGLGADLRSLEPIPTADLAAAAEEVEKCADGAALGACLADLLARIGTGGSPGERAAVALVRRRLRELAEEEVRLLAENID